MCVCVYAQCSQRAIHPLALISPACAACRRHHFHPPCACLLDTSSSLTRSHVWRWPVILLAHTCACGWRVSAWHSGVCVSDHTRRQRWRGGGSPLGRRTTHRLCGVHPLKQLQWGAPVAPRCLAADNSRCAIASDTSRRPALCSPCVSSLPPPSSLLPPCPCPCLLPLQVSRVSCRCTGRPPARCYWAGWGPARRGRASCGCGSSATAGSPKP